MGIKLKPIPEQTIVVTGGSSGIGLAIARRAAQSGAQVVLIARDEDALKSVCHAIAQEGGRADYVTADVGVREEVHKAMEKVVERHGGFDTWVNDAGIGVYAKLDQLSDEDHHKLFQTNYWGVVYGSLEALKHLRVHGGALINIGSISGDVPAPVLSAYTATKHAVKGFTNSLRLEVMNDKAPVAVTLIKPSGIHSPFGQHAKNYMDKESQVPPPVYHPDLVAKAVLYAAAHPVRDTTVGGAGAAMIWLTRLLPSLADQLYSRVYFHTALGDSPPRGGRSSLYEAGGEGVMMGDQDVHIRRHSLYTYKQHNRWLQAGCLLAGTALVTVAAMKYTSPSSKKSLQRQLKKLAHR